MLTAKDINGVLCCTNCEKPTQMHNRSVEGRALFWMLSGDSGISSEALCSFMLGQKPRNNLPPSDSSDRGRCIRLLELIPEWIHRLPELAHREKPGEVLTISASGISADVNSWATQIPLILQEGNL